MSDADQSGAGRREVAYRLFAAEYDDADLSYSEGEEERAPNYVVTPTGARVNRTFVVGVLTEVEEVSEDVLRARVVDPTGAFVLYAGQYQPDEQAFLDRAEPPTFVAVTGKARTFQPEDSDQIYTSLRPESINEVDADTRDRWTVGTAEQTLRRVGQMAVALSQDERGDPLEAALVESGVDEGLAAGIAIALDHYDTSPAYLAAVGGLALDAARLVAGDVDEVEPISLRPDAGGEADLDRFVEFATAPETDLESADVEASREALEGTSAGDEPSPTETGTTEAATTESATSEASSGDDSTVEAEATSTDGTVRTDTTVPDETGEAKATDAGESIDVGSTDAETTVTAGATDTAADESVDTGSTDTATDEPVEVGDGSTDVGDFEPGEFELDEEEREEIESEFGTEFQSGSEVDEPGEADIETPDPEEAAAEAESKDTGATGPDTDEDEPTSREEESTAPDEETVEETPEEDEGDGSEREDVDLADATVEVMAELDDGGGADREELVGTVAKRYDASPEAVEEAIQDALMDGRCYEPDDTTVKPI